MIKVAASKEITIADFNENYEKNLAIWLKGSVFFKNKLLNPFRTNIIIRKV